MSGPWRRIIAGAVGSVAAAGLVVAVAGCGGPDITQARVDDAVAPEFAALYARQQQLLGRPLPAAPTASATCTRNDRAVTDQGAGDDWVCQLLLQVGAAPTSSFTYELNVKADACFEADGPAGLVGGMTLTTRGGAERVNPLFAFDGCFEGY